MKRAITLAVILLFVYSSFAAAGIQTFVMEYTYFASELDSKNSCKAIAKEQLKRELLEKLGMYVESKTVVKDYRLEKDEITTLTAGVVQVVVLDERWDGNVYWLKTEMKADPDEVAASINKLKNDEHLTHELEEARSEAAQAIEELEALRRQLAQSTVDKQKQEQYNEAVDHLVASDYFESGSALTVAGNYEDAARAYDSAIKLQPEYVKAYINRSIVYVQLGRYNKAADDLKMASSLNPVQEDAYYKRIERQKSVRDLKVVSNRQGKSPIQGARVADPVQKLLDKKNEERKRISVHEPPERKIPARTEPSRNAAQDRSYNKEAITSHPALERKGELQNQSLRKDRELHRKQRVEEIRRNKSMKRQDKRKTQEKEREKELYKDKK